ncbi:PSME3-interacting protein isoform X1 [Equus asinus]|uniref:Proteasome activator subunit 3 interacting protein 1 n=2 Tax=Equus TaxID=9789 RepID=A0A9L0JB02_EQUAS|nr:PSME3-interacting protein isoform X1 [Equus asinus]XP_044617411.1 PSME3-interacting protein isoform X1 [Equus asinus]XP_044617412.1 PSME3-interacting protein isoform X1 [Equus asinus]XP_044617413.1 PSME3-interacting protein isoform X1 [Equus asinus]XP_044617414.1 PSME3-interacting protein isoform X1 [Equus asinus]XP_046539175.1 PSME3-interacting protein isoform X1 [Equus quagga]XP_046539177.1 PSME3-interacting protein isoform X1 [Equus quagga]XP_046539178.1 PSME3-interacting protein isofo
MCLRRVAALLCRLDSVSKVPWIRESLPSESAWKQEQTDYSIMDGGDDGNLVIKKRFVSEAELDERRKRRQEEWEKVRKPEDPEECPEEAYDPRSLYERLQEQKDRKQQEYEEQFKFKNMVRGLDEDETNFLDEVSRQQELIEKQRREEELKELKEYRSNLNKVGISSENKKEVEKKVAVKPMETRNKFSQAKLLAGAVKHKSSESGNSVKRLKSDPDPDDKNQEALPCVSLGSASLSAPSIHCPSAAVCIGILPGLGAYSGSSDSESSSDSEGTINATGKIVSSIFRTNTFLEAP